VSTVTTEQPSVTFKESPLHSALACVDPQVLYFRRIKVTSNPQDILLFGYGILACFGLCFGFLEYFSEFYIF
jgi:hypothetical protein